MKYENLNKRDLLALAKERGIKLPPKVKKRQIIKILKKPVIKKP